MKKLVWGILIFFLIAVILFVLSATIWNSDKRISNENLDLEESQKVNYADVRKGVGFVTKNNLADDLNKANEVGLVFLNAAHENGEIPRIIEIGFEEDYLDYPVANMAGNAQNPELIEKAYLELVEKYDPYYIGLGNEIERMADKEEFVSAYNGIYDSIKTECSDCVVYPVFQYEVFEPELADRMKLDMLVFTSYPFQKYSNIHDIPDNYYSKAKEVAERKNVKIAFTEIGWTTLPAFQSGEEDVLVSFYNRFNELTADLDVQFVSWGLLYGVPEAGEEFADMGLLDAEGNKKQIFYSFTSS